MSDHIGIQFCVSHAYVNNNFSCFNNERTYRPLTLTGKIIFYYLFDNTGWSFVEQKDRHVTDRNCAEVFVITCEGPVTLRYSLLSFTRRTNKDSIYFVIRMSLM